MSNQSLPVDFDLTKQWGLFCDRCGVPENKLPVDQRREMKRAFFGACGQLLILLRDELTEYEVKHGEEAASKILQNLLDQVSDYWEKEQAKYSR